MAALDEDVPAGRMKERRQGEAVRNNPQLENGGYGDAVWPC